MYVVIYTIHAASPPIKLVTRFNLKAGLPKGKIFIHKYPKVTYKGYPGGWATPKWCAARIKSPEKYSLSQLAIHAFMLALCSSFLLCLDQKLSIVVMSEQYHLVFHFNNFKLHSIPKIFFTALILPASPLGIDADVHFTYTLMNRPRATYECHWTSDKSSCVSSVFSVSFFYQLIANINLSNINPVNGGQSWQSIQLHFGRKVWDPPAISTTIKAVYNTFKVLSLSQKLSKRLIGWYHNIN